MISYKNSLNQLKKSRLKIDDEIIKSNNCINRVSSINVFTKMNNPAEDNAAFDGFAINSDDTKYLNSKGVIVPQNIVNTIFKKIPFLNLFSGPKNEGMILSTLFDMKGYLDEDLKISANYLSTITPGFLRNIFKKLIAKPQKQSTENKK